MADEDDLPFYPTAPSSKKAPAVPINRPRRARKSTLKASDVLDSDEDFTGPRPSTVKLKMTSQREGVTGHGGETRIGWDRELDSDADVPLAVEEQFILRVPAQLGPALHEQVSNKSISSDVWFKFLDSRRAVYHQGDKTYGAKLVDLPTLIESQRLTGNGGQTIKVADIHQMLLVEEEVQNETDVTREGGFNIEDFIYPHGITPPLKHVRKRRFRKRIDNRTVEVIENAVERLLEADKDAEQVKFEVLDYEVPSDEDTSGARPTAASPDESFGAPTPRQADGSSVQGDEDDEGDQAEQGSGSGSSSGDESGFDEDLLAEINNQMGGQAQEASDEDDDEDDESEDDGDLFGGASSDDDEEEEEDDGETVEQKKRIRLLQGETNDLDKAIAVKEAELAKQSNPIFKKRIEDMLKKLTTDRDAKRTQHSSAVRELEKKKEKQNELSIPAPAPVASSAPLSASASATATLVPPAGVNIVPPSPVVAQQARMAEPVGMEVDTPTGGDGMDQD